MNMEMQRQLLPLPIKLEEASQDNPEIIDLDSGTSTEDIILEWCTKVRMKFKYFFIADSERNLDIIMKWYIQTFKEDAMMIEDSAAVKPQLLRHIEFFKLFFHELDCSFTDNYLDNMEELLAIYSDLEAKTLPRKQNEIYKRYKKCISKVCHRIISILNIFLLYREDRLAHVVMKMKLNLHSDETKDLLNQLYGKILTRDPTNKSDLAFCRAYILYQKWKKIRSPEEWEQMDEVMYKTYNRTPESLGTNSTLKQILLPQSESILDVLSHISDNYTVITQEYFKIIKTQNVQEDSLISLDLTHIELDDQSPSDVVIDLEDEEFEHAYNNYVESMSKIPNSCNVLDSSCMKSENDQEEDYCQIVGVGTLDCEPKNCELVHEIIDDEDDDIIDIIFFEKKQENPVSFLDSIDVINKRVASPTILSVSTCVPSSTSSGISSYTVSPPPVERDTTPERPPEVFEQPPVSLSSKDEVSETIPPSNCFAVPSEKPPRWKRKFREPLRKKKIGFRKLNKKRRPFIKKCPPSVRNANKHSRKNCSETEKPEQSNDVERTIVSDVPKKVNHIETQTDFHHGDQEDIYKRFKGLVTPPSDEHLEDHDIHKESSNVYTDLLPPFQCSTRDRMTETDYLASSHAKSIEIDEREKFVASGRDIFNSKPAIEETAAQDVQRSPTKIISKSTESDDMQNNRDSEPNNFLPEVDSQDISSVQDPVSGSCCIKEGKSKLLISSSASFLPASTFSPSTSNEFSPESRKNTNSRVLSNVLCTSSDIANDYSPSSSTVSLNPKHRRSNETYSAPASPDISSTSHDNEVITRDGDSDENRRDYRSSNEYFSDTEDDEYIIEEDRNEVEKITKDINLPSLESDLNEGSDEILIEDHFLVSTNEVVDNSSSPINTEESVVNDEPRSVKNHDRGVPDSGANKTNEICYENENSENRNGTERPQLKQLKVNVPKVNSNNSPASDFLEKVRRQQERIFLKDKKNIHSDWDKLQMHHDLDDIWSGPIEKVNGISSCVNPDKTFDLFDNKTPCSETAFDTPTHSSTSVSDLRSPSYENIDDFQNYYLDNFKDAGDSASETTGQKVLYSKTTGEKSWEQLMARKSPVKFASKSPPVRKKRIVFAENIVETPTAHSPCGMSTSPLQGILKNAVDPETYRPAAVKRNTRPRIPRRMMNLKSLARFNVKPNDPCIQGVPCVVVERMSQTEIEQWNRVSAISRRVRLQKTQAQQSLTSAFRIDYDKTTTNLSEKDVIQFNKPPESSNIGSVPAGTKQWRSRKTLESHEGYKAGDLPYTDKKNGKRKRDNSVSSSQEKNKKRVYRKTPECDRETIFVRKTSRIRKRPQKDYDALIKGGSAIPQETT